MTTEVPPSVLKGIIEYHFWMTKHKSQSYRRPLQHVKIPGQVSTVSMMARVIVAMRKWLRIVGAERYGLTAIPR